MSELFSDLLKDVKLDVEYSIEVWKELLIRYYGKGVTCAYAKGSAVKVWETYIDYVPVLSDLDIHILFDIGTTLLGEDRENAFSDSIYISQEYERQFFSRNLESLHIPRVQLVVLNKLIKDPEYVSPRPNDVHPMIGTPLSHTVTSSELIRQIDLKRLQSEEIFLETLPESIIDRTGLDYWVVIRRMNWRVSPAPVRLLTQLLSEDPLEIWSWNRTRVCTELQNQGLTTISDNYSKYYLAGWQLFHSEFQDILAFRGIIYHGYKVLRDCLKALRNNR